MEKLPELRPRPRPEERAAEARESNTSRVRQLLYVATLIGAGGALYMQWPTPKTSENSPVTTTETAPTPEMLRELKEKACRTFNEAARQEAGLPVPPGWAYNRKRILRDLSEIGSCADPQSDTFNKELVCTELAEGIERNTRGFHPILKPFYVMLHNEIQCAAETDPETVSQELARLAQAIDEKIITEFPLVDPLQDITDICRPALEVIKNKESEIVFLVEYLTNHETAAQAFPALHTLLQNASEKYGSGQVEEGLKASIEKAAYYSGLAWLACSQAKRFETEQLRAQRAEVPQLIRELSTLISNDASESGEKAARAFMSIADGIAKSYPTR